MRGYLHPTTEARLRRFLMTRRVVPGHACISPEKANRIATEHSELFRVEVTEGGKGYWKYYFRSLIGNHSTSMEANALGWRYQLDRWVWLLARQRDFHGPTLLLAIEKTFGRHSTEVQSDPVSLGKPFAASESTGKLWSAFLRSGVGGKRARIVW